MTGGNWSTSRETVLIFDDPSFDNIKKKSLPITVVIDVNFRFKHVLAILCIAGDRPRVDNRWYR